MKKRILTWFLALCLLCGMVFDGVAFASSPVTLYTGGGTIYATDWADSTGGVYTGRGTLPTPVMAGAVFGGWYADAAFAGPKIPAGMPAEQSAYYARWTPVPSGEGGAMGYNLTLYGGNAYGIKGEEKLKAFFVNGGFYTATADTVPQPGETEDYTGASFRFLAADELFAPRGSSGIYLARTMTLEGNFVRLTYHVQNRGSALSAPFWLGAAADSMLGGNDMVPLECVTSGGQSYLSMVDSAAGNELRLYTEAATVTPPDRLWWGAFAGPFNENGLLFIANTFNSGKDAQYKSGVDSAFSFSWNVPAIGAGQTRSYSVLLGVGSPAAFSARYQLDYNLNGGEGTAPTDSGAYLIGASVTVSESAFSRTGYAFLGWNTQPDGLGASVSAGGTFGMFGDTTLYAAWEPLPYAVSLAVTEDGNALTGLTAALYQNGQEKYRLTEAGGAYAHSRVLTGTYDVYVDGANSGQTFVVNGQESAGTIAFATAQVALTLDGSAMEGRSVALFDGNTKCADLAYENGVYRLGRLPVGAEYTVHVDGDALAETLTTGTPRNVSNITATVQPKKDGALWSGAVVKAGTTTLAEKGGAYTAVLPAGSYAITVEGVSVGAVSSNTALVPEFFTVTFYDGATPYGASAYQKPQLVLKNGTATQPTQSPAHSSGTAVFDKWVTVNGGSTAFPFGTGITAKTSVYASWSTPVVIPGAPTRLSDSTYKFADLKITGYNEGQTITGYKIDITGGGSVTTPTETFSAAKTIAATETLLRGLTFTIGASDQTVTITVYGQ